MNKQLLETYTDYLMSSFSYTISTGLPILSDGKIILDKVTRFLRSEDFTKEGLQELIKPIVRKIQNEDGVIIIDDTIEENSTTDENEIICWHYDHSKDR